MHGTNFYTCYADLETLASPVSILSSHNFGTVKLENALLYLAAYKAKKMFKALFVVLAAAAVAPSCSGKNMYTLEMSRSFLCGTNSSGEWSIRRSVPRSLCRLSMITNF
jgi:hypothetical protein